MILGLKVRSLTAQVDMNFGMSRRYDQQGQLVETRFTEVASTGRWLTTIWKSDESMYAEHTYTSGSRRLTWKDEHSVNKSVVFGDAYPDIESASTDIRGNLSSAHIYKSPS